MTKRITRRSALAGLTAFAAAPLAAPALAQSGGGTVTVVHGFTPGGNVDLTGRIVAERLSARLSRQFIVEPKPGAGGTTAAAYVARSKPDGTTVSIVPGGHAVSAAIYNKLPYRPVEDFTFITMLTDFPFVFATYPDHAAKSLADFIKLAKAEPGKLLCATPGNGTGQHLALELFLAMAGIKVQVVPYRGSPQAATDLIAKRIDAFMDNPTVLGPMIGDGRVRGLATTGTQRFFGLPDLPTVAEQGVAGYTVTSWLGLGGPAGIPADIVQLYNKEMVAALAEPDTIARLRKLGGEVRPMTPDSFRARVASDIAKWTKVVADANIPKVGG